MGEMKDRMRRDMGLRGYSRTTIGDCLRLAERFARYHGRSPAVLGKAEIIEFLDLPDDASS